MSFTQKKAAFRADRLALFTCYNETKYILPGSHNHSASDENSFGNSEPNESGDDPSESSGSSDSYTTPPSGASGDNSSNPSTGITISLVPPAIAVTVITAAIKRKKK